MRRHAGLLAALVAGVLALAACNSPQKFSGTTLEQPYRAADIALTSTAGASYSLATDTTKPLTMVFFGYTKCPDACPLVMNNLTSAMNQLDDGDREQVDVVFVTTDPARDTTEALRTYLDRYDPSFVGLTGPLDKIMATGDPLHIYVSDGELLPSGGRDLGGHSTFTLALDDQHQAIALWNQDTSAAEYAHDIHTLLTED